MFPADGGSLQVREVAQVRRIYKEYDPIPSLLVLTCSNVELYSSGLQASALYKALNSNSKAYKPFSCRIPLHEVEDVNVSMGPVGPMVSITYPEYSSEVVSGAEKDKDKDKGDSEASEANDLSLGKVTKTLQVVFEDIRRAQGMASKIKASKASVGRALAWLDSRLPLSNRISIVMVAARRVDGSEVVLARPFGWGDTVGLPAHWCKALNLKTQSSLGDPALGLERLHAYVLTPLGLGCASVEYDAIVKGLQDGRQAADFTLPVTLVSEASSEAVAHDSDAPAMSAAVHCAVRKVEGSQRAPTVTACAAMGGGSAGITDTADVAAAPVPRVVELRSTGVQAPTHPGWVKFAVVAALVAALMQYCVLQGPSITFTLADVAALASIAAIVLPMLRSTTPFPPATTVAGPIADAGKDLERANKGPGGSTWLLCFPQGEVVASDGGTGQRRTQSDVAAPSEDLRETTRVMSRKVVVSSEEVAGAGARQTSDADSHMADSLKGIPGGEYITKDIADRFIAATKGNINQSRERLRATCAWREKEGIGKLLREGQPYFKAFKQVYTHAFLGKSKDGFWVYIEKAGTAKKAYERCKAKGVGMKELIRHMLFCAEYSFQVVDTRPMPFGKTYKIADLSKMGLTDLAGDFFTLFKTSTALYEAHYPETLHKMVMINVPYWFSGIWTMIQPLIDPNTKKRIKIFASNSAATKQLLQDIDEDILPVELGGKCSTPMYSTEVEAEMAKYVEELNRKNGVSDISI